MAGKFSPADAAMEGFQIVRRHPVAVLAWGAVVATFYILLFALGGMALSAFWTPGLAMSDFGVAHPAFLGVVQQIRVFQLGVTPFGIVLASVLSAAIYRTILRPEAETSFFLRLGGDELRLFLVRFILGALAVIGMIFLVLTMALLMAIGWVASGMPQDFQHNPSWVIWLLLGIVAVFGVGLTVAIRFSLASPMTFYEQKLRIFESWELTRGHFWSLLGAYLIAMILTVIVSIAAGIVVLIVGGVTFFGSGGPGLFAAGFSPSVYWLLTPTAVAVIIPVSYFAAIQYAVLYGTAAYCYRELSASADRPNPLHVREGAGPITPPPPTDTTPDDTHKE